jgi:hypothetical protein
MHKQNKAARTTYFALNTSRLKSNQGGTFGCLCNKLLSGGLEFTVEGLVGGELDLL